MASAPHRRRSTARTAGALAVLVAVASLAGCGTASGGADGDGAAGTAPVGASQAAQDATGTTPPTVGPAAGGCGTAPAAPAEGTPARVEVVSGGADRSYQRVVPTTYDGAPVPLVVDLHGYLSGAEGQAALSDLAATAEEHGFVLATPQGSGDLPYWNAVPHDDLPDDLAFVGGVIDDVEAEVCIDPDRVFVVGFSNGAFLASLVACRMADRVAAVAAVAGLLLPEGCQPERAVPVLAIHGTDDRYVGFDGAPGPALDGLEWDDQSRAAFDGIPYGALTATASAWAELDGCAPPPATTAVTDDVERVAHEGCDDGAEVVLYVVAGGGHTWPGSALSAASESILGPTTTDVDANDLIWSFFSAHPMP